MGCHPFGCRYDVNGDNEVELDELTSMIDELHGEVVDAPWMSDEFKRGMAAKIIDEYDDNGDVVLDKEEFVLFFVTKVLHVWINGEPGVGAGTRPELRRRRPVTAL